ncbi:PD40 domain-containing protein [Kitasatospora nipponensis]|uniref:PD40 domain-containing protein n=1 Tax=Kitasatospora nipponensis TaxID=258049 RepID=A0ABN1W5T9_9ACTN
METTNRTARTERRLALGACVLAAAAAVAGTAAPAQADPAWAPISQVDVGASGVPADQASTSLGLSQNGHYALFSSSATNLVPDGASVGFGLYVRDLRTGRTELVSRGDDGTPLTALDDVAGISGDGRYVVFSSGAADVAPGQPANGAYNVYVRDRVTARTHLVSAGLASGAADSDLGAYHPAISADGRSIVYMSTRTDLVPGAPVRPNTRNIFVTDRVSGRTRLASVGAGGQAADNDSDNPTINADATTVGFSSRAGNLLPQTVRPSDTTAQPFARFTSLYTYDLHSATTTATGLASDGTAGSAAPKIRFSPDGRYAAYALSAAPLPGAKSRTELFVQDLRTGRVTSVRTSPDPAAICWADPSAAITADDRWVYFSGGCSATIIHASQARFDLYRQNLTTGRTEAVSTAPDGSPQEGAAVDPYVSDNGRTVLFSDNSTNLLPGGTASADWHVYARTRG